MPNIPGEYNKSLKQSNWGSLRLLFHVSAPVWWMPENPCVCAVNLRGQNSLLVVVVGGEEGEVVEKHNWRASHEGLRVAGLLLLDVFWNTEWSRRGPLAHRLARQLCSWHCGGTRGWFGADGLPASTEAVSGSTTKDMETSSMRRSISQSLVMAELWNLLAFGLEFMDFHMLYCPLLRLLALTEMWNLLMFELPLRLITDPEKSPRSHAHIRGRPTRAPFRCGTTVVISRLIASTLKGHFWV